MAGAGPEACIKYGQQYRLVPNIPRANPKQLPNAVPESSSAAKTGRTRWCTTVRLARLEDVATRV